MIPSQPSDHMTDEVARPVIHLDASRRPSCDLLPERIDNLIRVQTAQHASLLAEVGHMRTDFRDLALAVRELATEIRPLVHDRVDAQALERAQAKLYEQSSNVSKAWADFIGSSNVKAAIAAIVAAAMSAGLLRGCGIIKPQPEMQEAQADGAWWRHR